MGREHIEDLAVWDGEKAYKITENRMIQGYWIAPNEEWVTLEEYSPLENIYRRGLFHLPTLTYELVEQVDQVRGPGIFLPDEQKVFFGEFVYQKKNDKWEKILNKPLSCRKRKNAVLSEKVLFLCAGMEKGFLLYEENEWKPLLDAEAGTVIDWLIPPDFSGIAVHTVADFGSTSPVPIIWLFDSALQPFFFVRSPVKDIQLKGWDKDWLYWFQKDPFTDVYRTQVIYRISDKTRMEEQKTKFLWASNSGLQVFTEEGKKGILWLITAGFPDGQEKLKEKQKVFEQDLLFDVVFSPNGKKLAVTARKHSRSPEIFLFIIPLPETSSRGA